MSLKSPSTERSKLKELLTLYKSHKELRYKIASWCFLIGFLSIVLFFATYAVFDTSQSFIKRSIRYFMLFPLILLTPKELFKWKDTPLIFKLSVFLIISVLISCFYGPQAASIKLFISPFKEAFTIYITLITCRFLPDINSKSKQIVTWILLAIGGIFTVALWNYFHPFIPGQALGAPRPNCNIFGPIALLLATFIVNLIPQKQSPLKNILFILVLSLLFSAMLLTGSRSTIIGLISLIFLFLYFIRDKRFFILLFATLISLSTLSYSLHLESKSDVISSKSPERLILRKDSGRINIWKKNLQDLNGFDYLIGKGYFHNDYHTFGKETPTHLHSVYLASYFNSGIISLFLLLSLSLFTAWSALKLALKKQLLPLSLLAATITFNLVDGGGVIFDHIRPFFFWAPIIATLFYLQQEKAKSPLTVQNLHKK